MRSPSGKICQTILILSALSTPAVAQETSIEEAARLVEQEGDESQLDRLERWHSQTGFRTWKAGKFSTSARYIESTADNVTLEKKDKSRITVAVKRLDFNSRVRITKIKEAAEAVLSDAMMIQAMLDSAAAERMRLAGIERTKQEYESSLTPKQRKLQETAREHSKAGLERESIYRREQMKLTYKSPLRVEKERRVVAELLDALVAHYKNGTLSRTVVQEVIDEHDRVASRKEIADRPMHLLEGYLFGEDNGNVARVLVSERPLVTRIDIYLAAGRMLEPKSRKLYGFNFIDDLDFIGDRLYWDYKIDQQGDSSN